MAKALQSITLQAPGFFGLNTEDSPTLLPPQYAVSARNCIIDKFGRIGARKGWTYITDTNPDSLQSMGEFVKQDATTEIVSTSTTAVYSGETTLTDITPVAYTMATDGRYDHASLNNHHYLFHSGAKPLVYDGVTCTAIEDDPDYSGTVPQGDIVMSAFGRLWVADTTSNKYTVYWSDLLTGMKWDTGSSGSIDLSKVWPDGTDEITGLATHNNYLIIFGKRQILVYTGAQDPATMALADTLVGIGCVARDSIVDTGTDILFLSNRGLKSFSRAIQYENMPIADVSKNVRQDFLGYVDNVLTAGNKVFSVYDPEDAFYLMHLPELELTYCFDLRRPLEDQSYRVTLWDSWNPQCMLHTTDRRLLIGKALGVARYTGYTDNGSTYQMNYFTGYLDFGAPSNQKILKSLRMTVIGGNDTTVVLNWGFDYTDTYKRKAFVLDAVTIAEFNVAEFNEAEYNANLPIGSPKVNSTGSGQVVQLGIQATISGAIVSIQSLTAQAIIGRTV